MNNEEIVKAIWDTPLKNSQVRIPEFKTDYVRVFHNILAWVLFASIATILIGVAVK